MGSQCESSSGACGWPATNLGGWQSLIAAVARQTVCTGMYTRMLYNMAYVQPPLHHCRPVRLRCITSRGMKNLIYYPHFQPDYCSSGHISNIFHMTNYTRLSPSSVNSTKVLYLNLRIPEMHNNEDLSTWSESHHAIVQRILGLPLLSGIF